jgi:phage-related protein
MKITYVEVKKPENKVIIELSETETAHLADFLKDHNAIKMADWPSVRAFAKELFDLAGEW